MSSWVSGSAPTLQRGPNCSRGILQRFDSAGRHGCVTIRSVTVSYEFDNFHDQHRPAMLRLAHLLCGSAEAGEEVAQEAFLVVHSRWPSLDEPAAYLRVVVVNKSRSVQRRQIRERRHLRSIRGKPTVLAPEIDETWQQLKALSADRRAAIVLRFYEDLAVAEIAEVMDKPIGTVKSLLHRGMAELKASMT